VSDLTLEVAGDERELLALGEDWNALVAATACATPFMSHGRLVAWWRAYGAGRRLVVLAYRDPATSELVGILPLYEERSRPPFRARRLRYLGDIAAAGLGPIVRRDVETDVLDAMARDLARQAVAWDVLELQVMDDASAFIPVLARAVGAGRCIVERGRHVCPRAALPGTWDEYLASLSKRMRHEIRRGRTEMTRQDITLETIRDQAALPQAVADLLDTYAIRMRQKLGASYEVRESTRSFLRGLSDALLADGSLRLQFFVKDGRRIAFVYQFRCGDTMYLTHQAFDPAWGRARVSAILLSRAIESAIEEGCTVYDFLLGAETYKYSWGVTDEHRLGDVHAYATSPRAIVQHRVEDAVRLAAKAARATPAPLRDRLAGVVRSTRRARTP
jgi:CelD/BcsL family acetyltransferase involved in cellulose biosynthesis